MVCQRCNSQRIASITAKCSDCCGISMGECEKSGYVPGDMGIGGGSYIEMCWCLECGQIQGDWPKIECSAEFYNAGKCEYCGWDDFDEVGKCSICGKHRLLWCPRCGDKVTFQRLAYGSHMSRGCCGCVLSIRELLAHNENL